MGLWASSRSKLTLTPQPIGNVLHNLVLPTYVVGQGGQSTQFGFSNKGWRQHVKCFEAIITKVHNAIIDLYLDNMELSMNGNFYI